MTRLAHPCEGMNRQRRLQLLAAGSALLLPAAMRVRAATSEPRKVGILSGVRSTVSYVAAGLRLFHRTMGELGWTAGSSVFYEQRFADGDLKRLPELAADLVRHKVDVILCLGSISAPPAMRATSTIPIVGVWILDPIGTGLAESLRRPGRNVTGTTWTQDPRIAEKAPELLRELLPGLVRMGAIVDPTFPGVAPYVVTMRSASARLGIDVRLVELSAPFDYDPPLQALVAARVQAVMCFASARLYTDLETFAALAARYRLPDFQFLRGNVEAGSLVSYGVDLVAPMSRAAAQVDKILRGANPAEMPFEQPTKYELVINRKRAALLGIEIPQRLLLRADEVIE